MSDLFDLLDRAAGPQAPLDPRRLEADVVRGRRALLRRRVTVTTAGLAAAASVAVVTTMAVTLLPGGATQVVVPGRGGVPAPTTATTGWATLDGPPAPTTSPVPERAVRTSPGEPDTTTTFRTGSEKDNQVPSPPALVPTRAGAGLGLRPGLVPKGWSVDGDDYVTTFSPPGVTSGPGDFVGKFVVSLATPPPGADIRDIAVVDGATYYGWLGDNPDSEVVGLRLADGRYLQFQAITPDLSVGSGYAVRLLLGITVTDAAKTPVG